MGNIKKFNSYLKEDLDTSIDNMKKTTEIYNRYKNRVKGFIDPEDVDKSSEDFNNFIENLSDEEKSASDMLRTFFNSEILKVKIENLEQKKKDIEEQIKTRIDELNNIQNNLP